MSEVISSPRQIPPIRQAARVLVHPVMVIFLIGVFYLVTIRPGHRWGDDFSMYILHARNIVQGIDYQDTGYLYDPFLAVIGPKAYPPVFPLALAPVYAFFGLELTPMKVEVICFFLLFLGVFYLSFKNDLTPSLMALTLAVIGLNPSIWNFKDDVISDFPFLFFVYLTLFVIQKAYTGPKPARRKVTLAVLTGVLVYLSFGTRNVGIVILPALFLYDLIRSRRPSLFPWIASVVFFIGWYLQSLLIPGPSGYADQIAFLPVTVYNNLKNYSAA